MIWTWGAVCGIINAEDAQLQFFEKELLSKVISFANDEKLKRIAQCVLDDNFLGNIIFEEQEDNNVAKDVDAFEDGCIMHRLATNYAIARGILALKKANGEDIALYDKEFYYKQKTEIFIFFYILTFFDNI